MANTHTEIEKRLWESADQLRANSKLKSSEYAVPVLGLIFLRYADHKFAIAEKELAGKGSGRRAIGKEDYQAKGVLYVPPAARYNRLRDLPDTANVGKAIEEAMAAIEAENDVLKGTFKAQYQKIDNAPLKILLKRFAWAFTGVVAVALPRSSRASTDTTGRPLVFQATVPGLYPLRAA